MSVQPSESPPDFPKASDSPPRLSRRFVAILAIAIVVSGVVGGFGGFLLGLNRAISSGSEYRVSIHIQSSGTTDSYQGQAPTRALWLVATVTLENSGTAVLSPSFRDWSVLASGGPVIATAEASFYTSHDAPPNSSTNFTVVFDTYTTPAPDAIRLGLPDGGTSAAALPTPGPRAIGVLGGRSTDGTNWTLTLTSVPSGLLTSGTKLTVISPGGSTALPAKAFNLLDYATDRAAYIQANSGSYVGVGDRLLISTTLYGPNGYTYQISDGVSILASGPLQG